MDTHHHAVIETVEPNLGLGMQRLQGGHSRRFNRRHDLEGHVFRHRYWSRRIDDDAWFIRACIYVVVNPVAAGLCATPREWRWSSFAATADGDQTAFASGEERLLSAFGVRPPDARKRYAEVVEHAARRAHHRRWGDAPEVWEMLDDPSAFSETEVPG
jgi:REP-associated tyrosine transposase